MPVPMLMPSPTRPMEIARRRSRLQVYYDAQSPSDYDSNEVMPEKRVVVAVPSASSSPSLFDGDDHYDGDGSSSSSSSLLVLRDALKRELLLLSSVTNRGEYAGADEQNMLIDLVAQLEALNPTARPASHSAGEWDLCLASTQFFRSSPFFQSLRAAAGDQNRAAVETAFDIHDRATTSGRVGRVRQTITANALVSFVDLEVGLWPGWPFRLKGTVVTTASLRVTGPDRYDTQIGTTTVTSSNLPLVNQWLDDVKPALPVGDIYAALLGGPDTVPVVVNKIFYLDEGMRITRDQDDNFFVYTRS